MSIETNRRDALAGAAVSGLVASVLASSATAQGTSVMAVATDADYQRDPTRWGSPEMAAHFPGFQHLDMRTSGAIIRLRHGGSGPPLLLVHGNPENHTCWYTVAGKLAQQYHVVLPDLRGYGDSSLPDPGPNNINFSFREMARDLIEVMEHLGYQRFMVAGHDRGGRTTHRLCLDHPERLISAVPAEYFIRSRMMIRGGTGIGFLTDTALNEYIRCYTLKTITGSCRDYRATATCDFEMDTADKDKKIDMPLLLLWGARGQSPERAKEFLDIWRRYASTIVAHEAIECGHYIQEEVPDKVIQHFTSFFKV